MRVDNYGCQLYELDDIMKMPYTNIIDLWEKAHAYLDQPSKLGFERRKEAINVAFSADAIRSLVGEILPPELHGKLNTSVIDECYYVVDRKSPSANGYYNPVRVTMHPKTAANIDRGSRQYGYQHILNQMDW